jgi:hypothetical protein
MSFREHATTETSALTSRLLAAWSEQSRRELQALRRTLDAAAQATEASLAELGSVDTEPAVAGLIEELTAAARAEAESAAARVAAQAKEQIDALRQELQTKAAEHGQLAATLDGVRTEAAGVKSQLAKQIDETTGVRAELARVEEAYARLEEARKESLVKAEEARREALVKAEEARKEGQARVKEATEQAQAELKRAQEEARAKLEDVEKRAHAAAATASQAKKALEQELKKVTDDLELAKMESTDVTKQLETEAAERAKLAAILGRAQAQMEKAQGALSQQLEQSTSTESELRRELEAATQHAQAMAARAEALIAEQDKSAKNQIARSASQPLDRLLNAFQKLEQSRTVRDVLTAVVDGLAAEFARVAVFKVNGNHLEIMRQLGFESDRDMSKVVIPLSMDSLLTEAVTTGRIQSLAGPDLSESTSTLFGGSPSFILVVPIAVADDVLAVVYADDSGNEGASVPQNQVKFAQLLFWHAVPRLPRLVREERERIEVQEYAVHLVQQLQESYEADVKIGRKGDELTKRMGENLKCARQMYDGRAEGLDGADAMFEECLSAVIEAARSTAFGKDLAAAAGRKPERAHGKHARQHVS